MQIKAIAFKLRKKREDNKEVFGCVIHCHSNKFRNQNAYGINM